MSIMRLTPLSWANANRSSSVEITVQNTALPQAFEGGSERPPVLAWPLQVHYIYHLRPPTMAAFFIQFCFRNCQSCEPFALCVLMFETQYFAFCTLLTCTVR